MAAPQVDECAVLRDVLHDAVDDHADFELVQGLALQGLALLFEQGTAAQHDVAALLVELDDLEVETLADDGFVSEDLEVAHGAQIDLAAGQERLDADVDRQAALDARGSDVRDEALVFGRLGALVVASVFAGVSGRLRPKRPDRAGSRETRPA